MSTITPQHENHLTTLELTVRNHPGVMSHITGLFARRAFNLEGILCAPLPPGVVPVAEEPLSRMYLLVKERPRLLQLEKQLEKLHDVLEVKERPDFDHAHFTGLHERCGVAVEV